MNRVEEKLWKEDLEEEALYFGSVIEELQNNLYRRAQGQYLEL